MGFFSERGFFTHTPHKITETKKKKTTGFNDAVQCRSQGNQVKSYWAPESGGFSQGATSAQRPLSTSKYLFDLQAMVKHGQLV